MGDVPGFRILLDAPTVEPALGFKAVAAALAALIEESEPQFAVGIFGGWGSGKTTLMNAVEARLDRETAIPVYFNAWRYEKEQHLIVPLLDTIRDSLLEWSNDHATNRDRARRT